MKRVYFIKPVGMDGPVKIGHSVSPDGRRETLETWSPFALEIVAEIEGGEKLELRFHVAFKHLHQRREWFSPAPELWRAIEQINAGTFDVDALPEPARLTGMYKGRRTAIHSPDRRYYHSVLARLRNAGVNWSQVSGWARENVGGLGGIALCNRHVIEPMIANAGGNPSGVDWEAVVRESA